MEFCCWRFGSECLGLETGPDEEAARLQYGAGSLQGADMDFYHVDFQIINYINSFTSRFFPPMKNVAQPWPSYYTPPKRIAQCGYFSSARSSSSLNELGIEVESFFQSFFECVG